MTQWKETSPLIWTLTLGNQTVKLAVFRPTYDRENWYYAINDRDSSSGYDSLQAAKEAAVRTALEQIEQTLTHLRQAKQEAVALLTDQSRTKTGAEPER